MQDNTNHIRNIGKSREDVKLSVEISLEELDEIVNSTEYVLTDGHDGAVLTKLYEDAKEIQSRYEGRE